MTTIADFKEKIALVRSVEHYFGYEKPFRDSLNVYILSFWENVSLERQVQIAAARDLPPETELGELSLSEFKKMNEWLVLQHHALSENDFWRGSRWRRRRSSHFS